MSFTHEHPKSASWPANARVPAHAAATGRPHRWRRSLLARLTAESLDRALADGADPRAHPVLSTRAAQLTGERTRRRLAAGLARAQRTAGEPLGAITAAASVDHHEVARASCEITALLHRLSDDRQVDPCGAARLRLLLSDGMSLLHEPVGVGSLARELRVVSSALEPHTR